MPVRRAIRAFAIGTLMLAWPTGASRADKDFVPRSGIFTISMPDGQRMTERRTTVPSGKEKMPAEVSQSTQSDGTFFLSASIGIPGDLMREVPVDKRFSVMRDALLTWYKGKVTGEKNIAIGSIPGKEYQLDTPKGPARMQIFIVGGFVIYAYAQGPSRDQIYSFAANAFFTSIKLTDKAKEIFAKANR
jgi:hypothetical protein